MLPNSAFKLNTMASIEKHFKINEEIILPGNLTIPYEAKALVIFSHGSGSSRFSPRNQYVAEALNKTGIATLLVDLLTAREDEVYTNRFNIELLSERLVEITKHVKQFPELKNLPTGYFGASTGAASALKAGQVLPDLISAIISRGGRPDLAGNILPLIKAPTLLIVGGYDTDVILLNKKAFDQLLCEKRLTIVKDAGHLFEEPGKLDEVVGLAIEWFSQHLNKRMQGENM